ncbi:uncharacterized protein LOC115371256 isoform X2 [Myripristis murdjan]|uniref:uncharacterized protein LOC115371256 isoform X2 n=1 Tax=Myripristis murdjan TaxID=586833 RepID=UPI001175E973|nr:uncharacterized protein LOC115371256 isoform X2 [Myripristis murdjan]
MAERENNWREALTSIIEELTDSQYKKMLAFLNDIPQGQRGKDKEEMAQIIIERLGVERSITEIQRVLEKLPRRDAKVQELLRPFVEKPRDNQQQEENEAAAPRPRDDQTPPPSADEKLRAARTAFINRASGPALDALLNELLHLKVINNMEMETIREQPRPARAQQLIDMVMNKGAAASSHMITIFCELDPFLSRELKLC